MKYRELQLVIAGRLGYQHEKLFCFASDLGLSCSFVTLQVTSYPAEAGSRKLLEIKTEVRDKLQDIVFAGHISDEERYTLMQNAEVFVYPSLYEGFAYPCLEAMSVGTPVVTSPVSALPEVLGDAALYADPVRPESIASVVSEVLSDSQLQTRLIEKGRACVKKYQNFELTLQQWEEFFRKIGLHIPRS